jgi:glycerol-3-phosphate O-acyltransferase
VLEGAQRSLLTRPASLVASVYERLFSKIPLWEAWGQAAREAAARGAVVYVLRNTSLIDLLALDYLTRRLELPPIGFSNELDAWLELPIGLRRAPPEERMRGAILGGESAVLFMKRPPDMLDRASATHRGRSEGDDLLRVLIDLSRREAREIILLPQTFVWTKRPERLGFSLVDTLFGPVEFPGDLRAAMQFLLNYKHGVLRAGEPLSLREFLAQEGSIASAGGEADHAVARRLTYALLRKVERERRAILGPAQKPSDRVREEVLRSPKLQAAMRDLAAANACAGAGTSAGTSASAGEMRERARAMLREMQAAPDPQTLRGLEVAADRLVEKVYSGVDVDEEGIDRVRAAAKLGSLVLLPSHKSHVDYMLLSYVLRKHALQIPVIAAGDNLAFFPVGPLFRRAGAFFIRRSFKGDRLYMAVVDAYIRRLLRDGWAIEFFLEGGRSRTGKLLPPKLGLLNMVVESALSLEGRRVFFVPVCIGYERMMEEGSYARELSGEVKRKEDAAELLKLGGVLSQKYGRANVQFGQVLELADLRARLGISGDVVVPAKRRALVTKLAHQVMSEINRVTAVTPGSLVAMALLCNRRRGLPHADLVDQCARLSALLRRLGARETPSLTRPDGTMREQAIRDAVAVYVRGGLVRQHVPGDTLTGKAKPRRGVYLGDDVIYTVPDDQRLMLDISKNIIVHFFVDRALISVALLSAAAVASAPLDELRARVRALSRLFKLEFMFRADAPFEQIFQETVADMTAIGELSLGEGDRDVRFGPGHDGLDGRGWISFYAAVVQSFIEGYRIAARAARVLLRGPLAEKDLAARALRIGEQMFLGGEIDRAESVSQPVLENALSAFIEQGYLRRADGELAPAEAFATEEAMSGIEATVASYLTRRSGAGGW